MRILLCSIGRRPYLVRWFKDALYANNLEGDVIAADIDSMAPARAFADDFILAPRVNEDSYSAWLADVLTEHEIELAISINDFELSKWATLPKSRLWAPLVRLSPHTQQLVEDKFLMSTAMSQAEISTPRTWLATAALVDELPANRLVVKGRYGSGSRGLKFTSADELAFAIKEAAPDVTTREGVPAFEQETEAPSDLMVVQEEIVGQEFGLDVVSDLDGAFAAVLARRKISMRSGETDRAVSVDPSAFEWVAQQISEIFPHPGLLDVDIIVDAQGLPHVIDINPRFGGGYPFAHLAGARVPNAYIAWKQRLPVEENWLRYVTGIVAGKHVEIAIIPQESQTRD